MSDRASLTAFRLADSFLPVGAFTASYGIEQFVATERVQDADDLAALVDTYLRRLVGPADLVALRAAHQAASDSDLDGVLTADRHLTAVTLPAEFRASAESSGARLLSLQRDLTADPLLDEFADRLNAGQTAGNFAVVFGVVAALADVPEHESCLAYCHGTITGLLGAAQRVLALGHTDIQRILDACQSAVASVVAASESTTLEEMAPFAPLVDVMSAEHERATRRLFAS